MQANVTMAIVTSVVGMHRAKPFMRLMLALRNMMLYRNLEYPRYKKNHGSRGMQFKIKSSEIYP